MVVFYEKIGLTSYLLALTRQQSCFYATKSGAARLLDWLCRRVVGNLLRPGHVKEFGWGDTEYVGHAIRDAAAMANTNMPCLGSSWDAEVSGINLAFLLRKFVLVEVLYRKYFFYELVIRYAEENPSISLTLFAHLGFAEPYRERLLVAGVRVVWQKNLPFLASTSALAALAFIMPMFWRRKIESDSDNPITGVVCHVESSQMLVDYLDLLQPEIKPTFVTTPTYSTGIETDDLPDVRIVRLGLSAQAYKELGQLLLALGRVLFRNFSAIKFMGWDILRFANKLVHGRILAPNGSNYQMLVCEHHDLSKTIRNEFIRKQQSKSILFPYSSLYALRFYADEYYENYDYVLSPGKHYEDVLTENESTCSQVVQVGTFVIHRNGFETQSQEKLRSVREFVGVDRVVTILCPGVCKPTYQSEIKLMKLANTLAAEDGVKVIIRQKPFLPEPQYIGFYEGFVEGNSSIMLTGMEFDLFDFLPVTSLFVTTYSTSACELAVCGANVLFVDYLRQDDRFIFWRKEVAGSLVTCEEQAVAKIHKILATQGNIQGVYRRDMKKFSEYIGYRFDDYEKYRANLMGVLRFTLGISLNNSEH